MFKRLLMAVPVALLVTGGLFPDALALSVGPIPIVRTKPEYSACGKGVGEVVLDFAVEPDGSVSDIKVIRATSRCFAQAAVWTVREWLYRPNVVDGKPIRIRTRVMIIFEPE